MLILSSSPHSSPADLFRGSVDCRNKPGNDEWVDEHQAREILSALTQSHKTVVLAMHDLQLALAHTDRIIGIRGGGIVLDAPSADLSPADLASLYNHKT